MSDRSVGGSLSVTVLPTLPPPLSVVRVGRWPRAAGASSPLRSGRLPVVALESQRTIPVLRSTDGETHRRVHGHRSVCPLCHRLVVGGSGAASRSVVLGGARVVSERAGCGLT